MQINDTALRSALDKLFTAFPLHYHSAEARAQRKQQYELYHQRLRDMPVELVDSTVLALIDTASYMPRIGTIRARVQACIKNRVCLDRPAAPSADVERTREVRSLSSTPPVGRARQPSVTGSCPRVRDNDGSKEPCGRPYEYTGGQVRWLRSQNELLLCVRCAGEYLARQGELRRNEAAWAEGLLARLTPNSRPTPAEVQRLRQYGFAQQLHERLIAIGAYSARRLH